MILPPRHFNYLILLKAKQNIQFRLQGLHLIFLQQMRAAAARTQTRHCSVHTEIYFVLPLQFIVMGYVRQLFLTVMRDVEAKVISLQFHLSGTVTDGQPVTAPVASVLLRLDVILMEPIHCCCEAVIPACPVLVGVAFVWAIAYVGDLFILLRQTNPHTKRGHIRKHRIPLSLHPNTEGSLFADDILRLKCHGFLEELACHAHAERHMNTVLFFFHIQSYTRIFKRSYPAAIQAPIIFRSLSTGARQKL